MRVIWQKPGQEFTHQPDIHKAPRDIYTVICQWRSACDACEPWQTVVVVIRNRGDAQDAVNNACLNFIGEQLGIAEAA